MERTNARYAITMDASGTSRADAVILADGTSVLIRPIRPDDETLMAAFHAGLSMRSVYQRYFHISSLEQRITHSRLSLTCRVDPAAGLAIVAEHVTPDGARDYAARSSSPPSPRRSREGSRLPRASCRST